MSTGWLQQSIRFGRDTRQMWRLRWKERHVHGHCWHFQTASNRREQTLSEITAWVLLFRYDYSKRRFQRWNPSARFFRWSQLYRYAMICLLQRDFAFISIFLFRSFNGRSGRVHFEWLQCSQSISARLSLRRRYIWVHWNECDDGTCQYHICPSPQTRFNCRGRIPFWRTSKAFNSKIPRICRFFHGPAAIPSTSWFASRIPWRWTRQIVTPISIHTITITIRIRIITPTKSIVAGMPRIDIIMSSINGKWPIGVSVTTCAMANAFERRRVYRRMTVEKWHQRSAVMRNQTMNIKCATLNANWSKWFQ